MTVDGGEAGRLARQRQDDLDMRHRLDVEMAERRGRKEALDDAHTEDQDKHLAAINGSIEELRVEMRGINTRLGTVETAFSKFVAVAEAMSKHAKEIADKGVSTRLFVVGVLALFIPIIVLILSLAFTGK